MKCSHYLKGRLDDMEFSDYRKYLEGQKNVAGNTLTSYCRDLSIFAKALAEKGKADIRETTNTDVISYLLQLKNEGKSASTVNRRLAALRSYFGFLCETGVILSNPTDGIKSPRIERKGPEFIPIEDMDKLLSAPDKSPKGMRDRAILELMYATGIRVSEVIEAKISDVNIRMGFISCSGVHSKARIVPMGRPARAAMEDYIYEARGKLARNEDATLPDSERTLFLNYNGEPLSRQGLWKILGEYSKKAGLEIKLTPQILRNSFAVHMLQNGADIKALQEMMGHEDLAATQSYLSVTKSRIKDVYDKSHPRA